MALDTSKLRVAVETAIRNGMADCGINPSGPEVKAFVDHQLAVVDRVVKGEFYQPDAPKEVPTPAATVGPVKPVNG